VLRIPKIEGILEHDGYLRLREVMLSAGYPQYCLLLVVGYHVGAREGELLSIEWPQVDLRASEIRLKAPTTKTKKARILPIYGEMKSWLEMARSEHDPRYPRCRSVFQKDGQRMTFNWRTWHRLCALAGVPELLFHDLRRTALTNMIRVGIPEKGDGDYRVPTRKTFERYHIVSNRDISEVATKMEGYLGTRFPRRRAKCWAKRTDDSVTNYLKLMRLVAEASGSRTHLRHKSAARRV